VEADVLRGCFAVVVGGAVALEAQLDRGKFIDLASQRHRCLRLDG
jgi:hypothetical protein